MKEIRTFFKVVGMKVIGLWRIVKLVPNHNILAFLKSKDLDFHAGDRRTRPLPCLILITFHSIL